jgi:hypothetical protein
VNHEETFSLLALYAVGAVDDPEPLEVHLTGCPLCRSELASLLATTARLGEAFGPADPPARLRARLLSRLASVPVTPTDGTADLPLPVAERPRGTELTANPSDPTRVNWERGRPRPSPGAGTGEGARAPTLGGVAGLRAAPRRLVSLVAALVIICFGLGGVAASQQGRLAASQAQLTTDEAGLALLTSTETSAERLNPVALLPAAAHGHWFHRSGVPTQVFVVESLPPPTDGESYVIWYNVKGTGWQKVGPVTVDDQGYGRFILKGVVDAGIDGVIVTKQPVGTAAPSSDILLRWVAPPSSASGTPTP